MSTNLFDYSQLSGPAYVGTLSLSFLQYKIINTPSGQKKPNKLVLRHSLSLQGNHLIKEDGHKRYEALPLSCSDPSNLCWNVPAFQGCIRHRNEQLRLRLLSTSICNCFLSSFCFLLGAVCIIIETILLDGYYNLFAYLATYNCFKENSTSHVTGDILQDSHHLLIWVSYCFH